MSITENIRELKNALPASVTLVAVSKFHPESALREAYKAGQRAFGESRVQELVEKKAALPEDIEWHFIGPLQTNKVKAIAPFIHMIQSVDSIKLLEEINKQAARYERSIPVLLEIHIAEEENKHGFSKDECLALFEESPADRFPHVLFNGLMGMATNSDDMEKVRKEFNSLHRLFQSIQDKSKGATSHFQVLSMGMTHDYPVAIEEGSTMIRVGTKLFGEREY